MRFENCHSFISRSLVVAVWVVILTLCISCQSNDSSNTVVHKTPLQQDLERILQWLPGEYDNHRQVYREAVEKVDTAKRHRQTHHIFHRVDVSYLPGELIYAQQSQHYDLKDIYRQRIYSFEIDEIEDAIKLTIYTPNDPEQLIDIHLDPSRFDALQAEDFYLKPGCEVYWKWDGERFNGYLKEGTCNYYSEKFQKTVYLNETLTLRSDALLLDDRAVDKDGALVFGVDDKGPTINIKE